MSTRTNIRALRFRLNLEGTTDFEYDELGINFIEIVSQVLNPITELLGSLCPQD